MAKIKNLHMADAVISNNDIRVTSTFFGLGEKATYLPTGSRITARVSDYTAFFLLGELIEFGKTRQVFSYPREKKTEDYITGRFG